MSAIDDILNFTNKAVVSVASAAKQAADNVLNNAAANAEEDKIQEAYIAIGKLYYRNKTEGTIPDGPAYDELVEKITNAQKRIDVLKGNVPAGEQ